MNSNKLTLLVIILVILILLYAVFAMLMPAAKNVPIVPVQQQQQQPEEVSEGPVYTTTESTYTIPTVQAIEENIKKQQENKVQHEEEAKIAQQKISEDLEEAPAGQEFKNESAAKTESKPQAVSIPAKKEFRFPTYEERKPAESKTGSIAY